MYNLADHVTAHNPHPPSSQQIPQLQSAEQYLHKHHIHQLFNELLAQLLENKPAKPKEAMISILKSIKEKNYYFKKYDFQAIFDHYDFFGSKGGNQINYNCIIQALQKIGINYSKEEFLAKHPQFKLQKMVKKIEFVNIMDEEYKAKVKIV